MKGSRRGTELTFSSQGKACNNTMTQSSWVVNGASAIAWKAAQAEVFNLTAKEGACPRKKMFEKKVKEICAAGGKGKQGVMVIPEEPKEVNQSDILIM